MPCVDGKKLKLHVLDEPDMEELSVVINSILDDLNKDNISLQKVTIVVDGGEILEKVAKVSRSTWPPVIHA